MYYCCIAICITTRSCNQTFCSLSWAERPTWELWGTLELPKISVAGFRSQICWRMFLGLFFPSVRLFSNQAFIHSTNITEGAATQTGSGDKMVIWEDNFFAQNSQSSRYGREATMRSCGQNYSEEFCGTREHRAGALKLVVIEDFLGRCGL